MRLDLLHKRIHAIAGKSRNSSRKDSHWSPRKSRSLQFHDPKANPTTPLKNSYGQYVYALHVVFRHKGGYNEIGAGVLSAYRDMIIRVAKERCWKLSRIGIVANHIHLLVGPTFRDAPSAAARRLRCLAGQSCSRRGELDGERV